MATSKKQFEISEASYVSSGDGQRQARRLAEQCFLIDNWRVYTGYSRWGRDKGSKTSKHFKNFTPIHGGSPEVLISMLTGKPGTQILFDMTPDQKALLVPKIRIFKSYLVTDPSKSPSEYKDVEFNFPSEAMSQEEVAQITKDKFGRGHGVGIQSFEWTYDGKDPAQVKYSTKCKLTLFFQNLADFTAPRKSREKFKGKDIQYKFSDIINPYESKIYSKEEGQVLRKNDDSSAWRLKAIVGWSLPRGIKDKKLMSPGMLSAINDCKVVLYLTVTEHDIEFNQDGSLRVTVDFVGALENALQDPRSNVFGKARMGLAESNARQRAFSEESGTNKSAIRVTPAEARAELDRRKREKDAKEGSDGSPSNYDSKDEELNDRLAEVDEDRLNRIIATYDNVKALSEAEMRREQQKYFINSLIASDRLKVAAIPQEELGMWNGKQLKATALARFRALRSDLLTMGPAGKAELAAVLKAAGITDKSVIEDMISRKPYAYEKETDTSWIKDRDISRLTNREKSILKTYTEAAQRLHKGGSGQSGKDKFWQEKAKNATSRGQSSVNYSNKLDEQQNEHSEDASTHHKIEDAGIAKDWINDADKSLHKWVRDLDPANSKFTNGDRTFVQFEFMYFGDIIEIALNNFANHPDHKRQKILMGDFYFFDRFTKKKIQINLADIPVSFHYFLIWYQNRIIKRDIINMSAHDFIKEIISYIINPMFGTTCYGSETGESAQNYLTVKSSTFNAPAASDGSDRLTGRSKNGRLFVVGGLNGMKANIVRGTHSKPDSSKEVSGLQAKPGSNPANIFNYTILYANSSNVNRLTGNPLEDSSNGIYHLRVGADRGLAKKFNFKAEKRKYAAEASVVDRNQRSDIEGLRGSKYNCDIEMIGNPLFQNGQYIFIDPSMMGFGNFSEKAFQENQRILRLGGYYLIIEVQCSIDSAGFQTTLKTLWENFPTNYKRRRGGESIEMASTNHPSTNSLAAQDPTEQPTHQRDHGRRAGAAAAKAKDWISGWGDQR